nr:MAG TPA: hypothetical protein [Bacteriophage sp.]
MSLTRFFLFTNVIRNTKYNDKCYNTSNQLSHNHYLHFYFRYFLSRHL